MKPDFAGVPKPERPAVADLFNALKQALNKPLSDEATGLMNRMVTQPQAMELHRRHRNAATPLMANDYLSQWAATVSSDLAVRLEKGIVKIDVYWEIQDRVLIMAGMVIPQKDGSLSEESRKNGLTQIQSVLRLTKLWDRSKKGLQIAGAVIAVYGITMGSFAAVLGGATMAFGGPKVIDNRHEIVDWLKNQGFKANRQEAGALQALLAKMPDQDPDIELPNPDGSLA